MTEQATTDPTADYWLGAGAAERTRLIDQALAYAAEAESLIDRLGVAAGDAVVDLGCGPLGILDLLADRVGPSGRVVGVDIEPSMLDMASVTLDERGTSGVELVHADIATTGLPAASFDLVHGRLVLLNNTEPGGIVAEMTRLARPGGRVAVQDLDKLAWTCEPAHPAWDRVLGAFRATRTAAGFDEYIGRRLPAMLRDGGLVDVDFAVHARVWRNADTTNKTKLVHFANVVRPQLLATGLLSENELDADLAALSAHLAAPDTFVVNALLVQAWGRTPE